MAPIGNLTPPSCVFLQKQVHKIHLSFFNESSSSSSKALSHWEVIETELESYLQSASADSDTNQLKW